MLAGPGFGADRPDLPGGKPGGFACPNSALKARGVLRGADPRQFPSAVGQAADEPVLHRIKVFQDDPCLIYSSVSNPCVFCKLFFLQAIKWQ